MQNGPKPQCNATSPHNSSDCDPLTAVISRLCFLCPRMLQLYLQLLLPLPPALLQPAKAKAKQCAAKICLGMRAGKCSQLIRGDTASWCTLVLQARVSCRGEIHKIVHDCASVCIACDIVVFCLSVRALACCSARHRSSMASWSPQA